MAGGGGFEDALQNFTGSLLLKEETAISDYSILEEIFERYKFKDYRWINASQIEVAHWVRFKCTFGCSSFGQKGSCPPQVPPVEECRAFFSEYDQAVIFHIAKRVDRPEERVSWSREVSKKLLEVEREVFWAGYHKAFMLFMDECRLCSSCTGEREACLNKEDSRPGPESLAVDVFSTVRSVGYPIEVLTSYDQEMNRYAFLMVE